jgi:DNA-binding transcriptional LysR family regulator
MELYQLEDFIAVVEERSFTRAAERVLRTQAAVSVAIHKLEEEVGVSLMTRDAHECTLTEAGQVTLMYARRIIETRSEMRRRLAEFTSLATGRVTVAAHESAVQYLLPGPLAAFHVRHPKIKIVTLLCNVDEVAELVAERQADLGFGIRQAHLNGLRSEAILSDPLVLVAAPKHRITRREVVHVADLGVERFFVHHLHTTSIDRIQQLFAEHGSQFDVAAELWSFETVKQFVRAGHGVAIIPLSVAKPDLRSGQLLTVPVQDLEITRSIEVVYRDRAKLPPATAELLEILKKFEWDRECRSADGSANPDGRSRDPLPASPRRRSRVRASNRNVSKSAGPVSR